MARIRAVHMVHPVHLVHLAFLLLALTTAGTATAADAAPTLEQVLERHVAALGGAEKLAQVESVELSGSYVAFSEEGPFTLRRARPNLYRFDYQLLGESLSEGYDGETAWTRHPLMGITAPAPMNGHEKTAVLGDAEMFGPLASAAERGHRLTLVGLSDFDGIEAFEVKVTRADGGEETWFLDAGTYLPVGRVSPTTDWGQPHPQKTFFDDWREVSGVKIPHYVESEFFIRHRVLTVTEAKVNGGLDRALFALPVPEPMRRLALAGDYRVAVEAKAAPVPQAPWLPSEGSATFTPEAHGALLVERLAYTEQDRPTSALRTWSWDAAAETYRVTHYDDVGGRMQVLQGKLGEEGALVLTDLETGTALKLGDQTFHTRWTVKDVGSEGMRVEVAVSSDGGETWAETTRFAYARPPAP